MTELSVDAVELSVNSAKLSKNTAELWVFERLLFISLIKQFDRFFSKFLKIDEIDTYKFFGPNELNTGCRPPPPPPGRGILMRLVKTHEVAAASPFTLPPQFQNPNPAVGRREGIQELTVEPQYCQLLVSPRFSSSYSITVVGCQLKVQRG
jgi:hypothetical protein